MFVHTPLMLFLANKLHLYLYQHLLNSSIVSNRYGLLKGQITIFKGDSNKVRTSLREDKELLTRPYALILYANNI